MLNPLFAFGVPAALMVAYMIFYFAKRVKNSDYRRFVLTLIAVFLTTFSYQVYNYSQTVISITSAESFQKKLWIQSRTFDCSFHTWSCSNRDQCLLPFSSI